MGASSYHYLILAESAANAEQAIILTVEREASGYQLIKGHQGKDALLTPITPLTINVSRIRVQPVGQDSPTL